MDERTSSDLNQAEPNQARQELQTLLNRCKAGDVTAKSQLVAFLDERPDVWQQVGDLAHHLLEAILALAGGQDLLAREALRRKLEATRLELAGDSPSPVRRLLAQRVVLLSAITSLVDLEVIQAGKVTGKQATSLRRRQQSATKLYLESLRLLHSFDRTRRAAPRQKSCQGGLPVEPASDQAAQGKGAAADLRLVG